MYWEASYRSGEFRRAWDSAYASTELVGYKGSLESAEKLVSLDVGCGSGEDAIFMSIGVGKSYGIDISPTAVSIATRKSSLLHSKVEFVVGDLFSMPFPAFSIDMVTDRGCLHNIDYSKWDKYESEVSRVLRPGGILFLRGARRETKYDENFSFIEPETVKSVFIPQRWRIKGSYPFTMFSGASDGILLSNLFILQKAK